MSLVFCASKPTQVFAGASASKLGTRLAAAIAAPDVNQAFQIIESLGHLESPKAMDELANKGIGHDRAIDVKIMQVLLTWTKEDAIKRLCKLTNKHPRFEVRVVLSFVCSRRKDPDTFAAMLYNLVDRSPSVVLSAIEGCLRRNDLGAVDHLISALVRTEKSKQNGLIRIEILKALEQFTGEVFDASEDWQKFWKARKKNFKRPEAGSGGLTGRRVKPRTEFFGLEVPTDNVVFVLDISGSMRIIDPALEEPGAKGGKGAAPESRMRIRRVKTELIRVLEKLDRKVNFNIIAFNHEIIQFQPKLVQAGQSNKNRAIKFVRSLKHEGYTHTDDALEAAFDFQKARIIYLLSDGCPRRDDIPVETDPIVQMVKKLNRFRRVHLNTIGFMQAGGKLRKFLRKLAEQNHGKYKELK